MVAELELILARKEAISSISSISAQIHNARKLRKGSRRLALCHDQRSCRARNRNPQSKDP